jgi:leader peptidase (prepilin peptidase)/N-methyltransferase
MGWGILAIGFCIGSFLNVAIHRIPRGLLVNDPKRSFCPSCKATLPWWQNLPVLTWVVQQGKCRHCQQPISVRYLLVEVLTGGLFYAAWSVLPMGGAILSMMMLIILVTISFIDGEHQVIPIIWTTAGVVIAALGSLFCSDLLNLLKGIRWYSGWIGLRESGLGWLAGFGGLYCVVLLGKLIWGTKKRSFTEAITWKLQEGFGESEQLHWVIDGEGYSWDDLFFRPTDELVIHGHGFQVDGQRAPGKEVRIRRDDFSIGERKWSIAKLKSLAGKATEVSIPREAMGMGDPHLLGMIGAFLGWASVIYVVFASSIFAIVAAVVARVGFGRPLPFGPFLSLAAVTWVFGGWQLWEAYFNLVIGKR